VCEREGVLMCVLRYVTLRMIKLLKGSAVTVIQQKVFYYGCSIMGVYLFNSMGLRTRRMKRLLKSCAMTVMQQKAF